jgi:hypothetical protein
MLLGLARAFLMPHLIEKAKKLTSRKISTPGQEGDRFVLSPLIATNAGASR